MELLIKQLDTLIDEEYDRAELKFGAVNNSDHESYAILLEEVEEAEYEVRALRSYLQSFWLRVKAKEIDSTESRKDKERSLVMLQQTATFAAAEYIQVAAMCVKARRTIACDKRARMEE